MDEYIHNPVGNEHPLRGCMIGVALAITLVAVIIVRCCIFGTTDPDTDIDNQQIATVVSNDVSTVSNVD